MPLQLCQVAWECGDCATTNQGRELLPCWYCRAENPCRYEILLGSAPAAIAWTTYTRCTEQHDIVWAASEACVVVTQRPIVDRALYAEHLMGTKVDIVRTETDKKWQDMPCPQGVRIPACPREQGLLPKGNSDLSHHRQGGGLCCRVCCLRQCNDLQGPLFAKASRHSMRVGL